MLRMIVDRCHVADSNRKVIRYVISRLKRGYATWRKMPKEDRRQTMKEIIKIHRKNLKLYSDVMSGRIGKGE